MRLSLLARKLSVKPSDIIAKLSSGDKKPLHGNSKLTEEQIEEVISIFGPIPEEPEVAPPAQEEITAPQNEEKTDTGIATEASPIELQEAKVGIRSNDDMEDAVTHQMTYEAPNQDRDTPKSETAGIAADTPVEPDTDPAEPVAVASNHDLTSLPIAPVGEQDELAGYAAPDTSDESASMVSDSGLMDENIPDAPEQAEGPGDWFKGHEIKPNLPQQTHLSPEENTNTDLPPAKTGSAVALPDDPSLADAAMESNDSQMARASSPDITDSDTAINEPAPTEQKESLASDEESTGPDHKKVVMVADLLEDPDESLLEDPDVLIKAPKVHLPGLTVKGKIELPEPKPKPEKEVREEDEASENTDRRRRGHQRGRKRKDKNPVAAARIREERKAERKKKAEEAQNKARKKKFYQENIQSKSTPPKKKSPRKDPQPEPKKETRTPEAKPNALQRFWKWMNT